MVRKKTTYISAEFAPGFCFQFTAIGKTVIQKDFDKLIRLLELCKDSYPEGGKLSEWQPKRSRIAKGI